MYSVKLPLSLKRYAFQTSPAKGEVKDSASGQFIFLLAGKEYTRWRLTSPLEYSKAGEVTQFIAWERGNNNYGQ